MLLAGDTVRSRIGGQRGTVVPPVLEGGKVRVRFDGETWTQDVHESRLLKLNVDHEEPRNSTRYFFRKGDYIEVTDRNGNVFRGAAIENLSTSDYAMYDMLTDDGVFKELNINLDKAKVLFSADIARGESPRF